MNKITFISCLLAGCLALSPALAQNKVVVIPMGSSSAKVAGSDMQVQYNDNGTLAGANVYYNKTNGFVGIGNNNPDDYLSILNMSGDAGVWVGSTTETYINMESLGANRFNMAAANDDNTNTKYPMLMGMKARGTYQAYQPVLSGDRLLGIFARGQVAAGADLDYAVEPSAGMIFIATEDWVNAPAGQPGGSRISLFTTENSTGAKTARMLIDNNGNVGIGTGTATPTSTLQVNGYVQLALTSGAPPVADCDAIEERGRMMVDNAAGNLYICMDTGWVAK